MDINSSNEILNSITENITADIIFALLSFLATGFFLYFRKKIINEHEKDILNMFQEIISKLSSDNETDKISAAILLRKFFNKSSTLGKGGKPLEKEVCSVITGILKKEKTSHFQKILADSLRYADSLEDMDLQFVNLTNAFLGREGLNLKGADFFRANLTNATFKPKNIEKLKPGCGVDLSNSVFYETIIENTNFSYANLQKARFYNIKFKNVKFEYCNLKNINFDSNCIFENVSFKNSINFNANEEIMNLQKKYNGKIFISHPRIKLPEQEIIFEYVKNFLINKGYKIIKIDKQDEQNSIILRQISKKIEESNGLIAFNFKQLHISKSIYRWWNINEKKEINNTFLSSPWIIVESAMAIKQGIPVFVISEIENEYDIFNQIVEEENIFSLSNITESSLEKIGKKLEVWLNYIKKD